MKARKTMTAARAWRKVYAMSHTGPGDTPVTTGPLSQREIDEVLNLPVGQRADRAFFHARRFVQNSGKIGTVVSAESVRSAEVAALAQVTRAINGRNDDHERPTRNSA